MALTRTYSARPSGLAGVAANFFDSRAYQGLQRFAEIVGLNLLWAVAALPIITLFPATAAMFAVARKWARGDDPAVFTTFWQAFRDNFRQAMALQLIWGAVLLGVLANLQLADTLPALVATALLIGCWVAFGVVAAATMFLFPLMVHYQTSWRQLIKWSVLLAIGRPATTLRCGLVVFVVVAVSTMFIAFPLLAASATATAVYRCCQRAFDRLEAHA